MTALERLGLEVAAYTLLGSRAQAALLCAMLDASGRPVPWLALAAARPWRRTVVETNIKAIHVRIHLLRDAMEDVGLAGLVKTVEGGEILAYALPEPGRTQVLARLIEVAETA